MNIIKNLQKGTTIEAVILFGHHIKAPRGYEYFLNDHIIVVSNDNSAKPSDSLQLLLFNGHNMKFTISNRWTVHFTIDLFDYHGHNENLKIYHIKSICRHDIHEVTTRSGEYCGRDKKNSM